MKISDGIYLVGSGQAGFMISNRYDSHVYLIEGSDGHVLIDAGVGLEEERIVDNIKKEGLDPEDGTEIMNGAFHHLNEPIHRYDGTVAKLMGDAVLAFFGAPVAHEDDPQRAVRAALDMLRGIAPAGAAFLARRRSRPGT